MTTSGAGTIAAGDPRIPPRDTCVLPLLLQRQAVARPDATFAVFEDGTAWSYGETLDRTRATAAALRVLGVGRGDRVLLWMANGPDMLRLYLALGWLGAVFVPINTGLRGAALEHVVADADAPLLICDERLAPVLADVETGAVATLVVNGTAAAAPGGVTLLGRQALAGGPAEDAPEPADLAPWDLAAIHYTSGTTGLPKGVLVTHLQMHAMAVGGMYFTGPGDRFLVNLPLFHIGGTMYVFGTLMKGASLALVERFRTETFWDTVRELGVTSCLLLGAIASFLVKRAPSEDDRDHGLASIAIIPLTEDGLAFGRRFGVDVYTFFDMTETSAPLASGANPSAAGSCGCLQPGYEVRIVDENDCEVPVGATGELIVRCDTPWAMAPGYFRNAEATAKAWRNGWFHTGDAFRHDAEGNFFFVDRMKDTIRRRGENISSNQVEAEVLSHPDVEAAAAIGVPSEHSEEEILVVLAPKAGRVVDPADLLRHLEPRLARFMLPRYVRILAALPLTETNKVQKKTLRAEGVTADTWDRDVPSTPVQGNPRP